MIIYLLLYHLHDFTFKEINFRGFHGFFGKSAKINPLEHMFQKCYLELLGFTKDNSVL